MAYASEFRQRVVVAYLEGEGSLTELAETYGIDPQTLHRWVLRARNDGEFGPRASPGRRPQLEAPARERLRPLVDAHNDVPLPTLARMLADEVGVTVSSRTVGRALRRLDISTKKSRAWRSSARTHASRGVGPGTARGLRGSTRRA